MTRAGWLALWLGIAGPLAGQAPSRAAGVVVRPDSAAAVPVPGVRVVLHHVGPATQGPIDTTVTDARGRFSFRFAADTSANYLVSARHAGIEYFSNPLATNPARPDTGIRLLVYDTSSTVPISTRSRTLVIGGPDAIGARSIVDWMVIRNAGRRTRVGPDTLAATWGGSLPAGARNPRVGDARLSQISPEAVLFRGDSILVLAPLAPGEKELLLQYELPAEVTRLALTLGAVDSADVFLEERGARVAGAEWRESPPQMFEGRSFRRLDRAGGGELAVTFPGRPLGTGALPVLVGAMALALVVITWRRLRLPVPPPTDPRDLADRIARLDQRAEAAPAEERERLGRERETLLAELRAALARRGPAA